MDKLFIFAGKCNGPTDVLQKVFESLGLGTTTCISSVSFIMGEATLAHSKGHTIPRLEIDVALLGKEVREFIRKNLHTTLDEIRYHTDSKVVLGNKTKSFFNFAINRVERILSVTEPKQCFLCIDS